jgi:predicted AAA+ superfamily ATPase
MMPSIPPRRYRPRLVDPYVDNLFRELPALMLVGPRTTGKTTTAERRAATTVRLNVEAEAAAFAADPDAALRGLAEPVLLDEWQAVPGSLGAASRAANADPHPGRFLITGSVRADLDHELWPATGRLIRIPMFPMNVREQRGRLDGPTFFDAIVAGRELPVPTDSPDLRGYVELGLLGGFPLPALILSSDLARTAWHESYIEQLLTHDIEQVEEPRTKRRDPLRLRRYFEAYALNSAGVCDHKTIYDAAQINYATAVEYDDLLERLFVIDQIPAWASNRLSRLTDRPKRYIVDTGLLGALLRLDANGVLRDKDLLGRFLDTFVAAQLRPEVVVSESKPRLHHLRTKEGRQEIDLLAELGGDRVIAMEVKANAKPDADDAKHLAWLRNELGERFIAGVIFHTGPRTFSLGDRITAAPISTLWPDVRGMA